MIVIIRIRRKVELSGGSVKLLGGLVVGEGSFPGSIESSEPEAGAAVGFTDLRDPLPPGPLPYAAVLAGGVLRSAFPSHAPFPRPPHHRRLLTRRRRSLAAAASSLLLMGLRRLGLFLHCS